MAADGTDLLPAVVDIQSTRGQRQLLQSLVTAVNTSGAYGPTVLPSSLVTVAETIADGSVHLGSAEISNSTRSATSQLSVAESANISFVVTGGGAWYSSTISGAACGALNYSANVSSNVSWNLVEHTNFWNALMNENTILTNAVTSCSGPCQKSFPLLSNMTYSILMLNAASSPYSTSYSLSFYAPGSADCQGLESASEVQPNFTMPAGFADGFVTGQVLKTPQWEYGRDYVEPYSDLFVLSNASCALLGLFTPSVYAANLPEFTVHLAFSSPDTCHALAANATVISSATAGGSSNFGNGTLVSTTSDSWNIKGTNQYLNVINGAAATLGQYVTLNRTIDTTASFEEVDRTGFIRDFSGNQYDSVGSYWFDDFIVKGATQNLTVFAPGAAECASLPPPQAMPTANSSLIPQGYFNGSVTSYSPQLSQSTGTGGWNFIAAYSNVSCLFLALASSSNNITELDNLGLHLVPESALLSQISARGYLSSNALRNGNETVQNVFCNGFNCSAAQGQWLPVYDLNASETYIVIADTGSQDALLLQEFDFFLVQGLSGSDECQQIRTDPQAQLVYPGASSAVNGPTQSSGSSSNAGAIAGGVVGGVVGAALVALAAFLFVRRRRRKGKPEPIESQDAATSPSRMSFLEMGEADWSAATPWNPRSNPLSAQLLNSRADSMAPTTSSAEVITGSTPGAKGTARAHQRAPSAGSSESERQWFIDPATITVERHADGTPIKLGQGGFGSVYKALQDSHRVVAVKISTNGANRRHDSAFWREIAIIAGCRDRNILQFYGAAYHGPEILLVTEFCERGDLYNAIGNQPGEHIAGEFCWYRRGQEIALDVARGLFFLHSRRIVHNDVKSPNVLLTRECLAKIADVGLAHPLLSRSHMTATGGIRGTWAWQAPETIVGTGVTTAADIWSFGVIMWELMTGERPQRGQYRSPRVPKEAPASAVALIQICMLEDPTLRPTAGDIIQELQGQQH
ncbi:hypothetical protein WJX73_009346 [Symbiochloris irregularis]|uniref:Protein kinase domain-containing protein n=1 Tax=Symbiochloris irregularis TaxID=706552 RepID=A0AAW1PVD9_9CHLO